MVILDFEAGENPASEMLANEMNDVGESTVSFAAEQSIRVGKEVDFEGLLTGLDLGHEVPSELYQVVAEVLTWLYRVKQKEERSHTLSNVGTISAR